jgi:hypothetical protein
MVYVMGLAVDRHHLPYCMVTRVNEIEMWVKGG